jgi:cation:H+ antiporter
VIGSNLANIGLIVGLAGLLRPLAVQSVVVRRELPMMLLATAVAFVFALDSVLDGDASSRYGRGDGIVLLLLLGVFLYYTAGDVFREREGRRGAAGLAPGAWSFRVSLFVAAAGLVALVGGAHLTVKGAVGRCWGSDAALLSRPGGQLADPPMPCAPMPLWGCATRARSSAPRALSS